MRIVSMLSSATEIVCALGMGDHLVGRSHECDFPEWVKALPCCTEPKFDVTGSSAEIDRLVRETMQTSVSIYRVFDEVVRSLRPDVIVTQIQCEVCAVSLRDVEAALKDSLGIQPTLVALQPNCLADIWDDIRRVARACGIADRGESLFLQLNERMQTISSRANHWGRKPTVACLEWLDPLMASGNWMPELVELAGGVPLFGTAGQHSPGLSWEELVRQDPDVIIGMPCGFDLPRTRREMVALTSRPEWSNLRAVRSGRVHVADGNAYFNRPGPRLVETLEMLAEAIVPGAFAFAHPGLESF